MDKNKYSLILQRMVGCFVALFLFATVPVLATETATKTINSLRTATWNMQGIHSRNGPNRWAFNIRLQQINPTYPQVLALQESGTVNTILTEPCIQALPQPGTANGTPLHTGMFVLPHNWKLSELFWEIRDRMATRYRWIYHIDHDQGAHRVNVSIVSDVQADSIIVLPSPLTYNAARPILGIQRGNNYYFTVHGAANRQLNYSADIINRIFQFMLNSSNNPNAQWMIMGDFNLEPAELSNRITNNFPGIRRLLRIYHPRHATHRGGRGTDRMLDYAIVGSPTGAGISDLFNANIESRVSSDHYWVDFIPRGN